MPQQKGQQLMQAEIVARYVIQNFDQWLASQTSQDVPVVPCHVKVFQPKPERCGLILPQFHRKALHPGSGSVNASKAKQLPSESEVPCMQKVQVSTVVWKPRVVGHPHSAESLRKIQQPALRQLQCYLQFQSVCAGPNVQPAPLQPLPICSGKEWQRLVSSWYHK